MLEAKIKLVKAMEHFEPKKIVKKLFDEYDAAYYKLHKPSEKHTRDHVDLYFKYLEYMNKLSGSQK